VTAAFVAAAVVRRERKLVSQLRESGALSPSTARSLSPLEHMDERAFRRLRAHQVIREARPDYYYLDEPSWQALESRRRQLSLIMVAILIAVVLALYFGLNK
jgi:hypothetical protein